MAPICNQFHRVDVRVDHCFAETRVRGSATGRRFYRRFRVWAVLDLSEIRDPGVY